MAESRRSESPVTSDTEMSTLAAEVNMDTESTSSNSSSKENLLEDTVSRSPKEMELEEGGPSTPSPAVQGAEGGAVEGAVDRLLERHRNEIMFELRRLKMGDRPVTGQGHKEAVNNFFRQQMAEAQGAPPSEDRRPEAVVVEVQGLVESRPVSSVLQSARFRRQLENSIRGALSRVSTTPAPPRQSAASLHRQVAAQAAREADRRTAEPRPSTPTLHSQVVTAQAAHAASRRTATPANIPAPPPLPPVEGAEGETEPVTMATEAAVATEAPAQAGPERAQAWLQQLPDVTQHVTVWDSLEQQYRDNIVMEISELVQRQLVTGTLTTPFRNILESRMRDHVESTGTDGQRVQQFIQNIIPSQPIRRNDFTELGIAGPAEQGAGGSLSDNMDNVSVISATAAVHVNQAQTASMNREMRALRSQIDELKNMMRLSFDLQLDIQRSIRQEVAAAMAQALAGAPVSGTPVTTTTPAPTRPVDDPACLICLDRATDSVLYQCGHMCVCYTCGLELRQRGAHCPVCRAPIRDIIRAYRTNREEGDQN